MILKFFNGRNFVRYRYEKKQFKIIHRKNIAEEKLRETNRIEQSQKILTPPEKIFFSAVTNTTQKATFKWQTGNTEFHSFLVLIAVENL